MYFIVGSMLSSALALISQEAKPCVVIAFSVLNCFLGLIACLTVCDSHTGIKGVINAFILGACPSLS